MIVSIFNEDTSYSLESVQSVDNVDMFDIFVSLFQLLHYLRNWYNVVIGVYSRSR
jgi:hypothetical protein